MELSGEERVKALSEEIENCKSIVNKKEKCYIQHKLLNNLINIYQHRVTYFLNPKLNTNSKTLTSGTKTSKSPETKSKIILPSVSRHRQMQSQSQLSLSNAKSTQNFFYKQKSKQNQSEILQKMRQIHEAKLRQQAKDLRDKMRIMNDNFKIYKESIIYENINKRRIIETQRELVKDSINNYQLSKKQLINSLTGNDIERVNKLNKQKINELKFLKMTYKTKNDEISSNSQKESNNNSMPKTPRSPKGIYLSNTLTHQNKDMN